MHDRSAKGFQVIFFYFNLQFILEIE